MVHRSFLATLLPNSRQFSASELPDMAHGVNVLLANTGVGGDYTTLIPFPGSISPGGCSVTSDPFAHRANVEADMQCSKSSWVPDHLADEPSVSLEVVVHAEAENVGLEPRVAGEEVVLVGEVDIEIFRFRRPGRSEANFQAEPSGPADVGRTFGEPADLHAALAIREP